VAKISLIRTYRVFSSGSGRRRKDGCGSDGRSGLGVAALHVQTSHLDSASENARPTAGPAPLLERRGTKISRMSPRVVFENSCREDSARESDERTPSPRFESAACGAGSFLAAGHGLDSCELDCGPQILSRDPVTFVFSAQRVSRTGRMRVDGPEDSFSTKVQVVLSAPETRPVRTSGRIVDILPAMNGGDSYGVPAGFGGISGFLPRLRRTTKRLNFRAIHP